VPFVLQICEAMITDPRVGALILKTRVEREPAAAWAGLDALFRAGRPPEPPLDGDTAGELLATRTILPFDALMRAFDRRGLWWLGKSFDAAAGGGENRWDPRFRRVVRVCWPLYRGLRKAPGGELRGFRFRTALGPGVLDPDRSVLKIDYSAERNPFLIRRVLDELVQVGPEYFVGKAHLRLPGGRWRTVAFFALRPLDR
jgi:hypothetical protein